MLPLTPFIGSVDLEGDSDCSRHGVSAIAPDRLDPDGHQVGDHAANETFDLPLEWGVR